MNEKDFNDKINCSYFDQIKDTVQGQSGYKVIAFMDTAHSVKDLYTDQLNDLIGTFIDSKKRKLTQAEKAALYDKLTEQSLKLGVNIISLDIRLGQLLALLLDSSDDLLVKFLELNKVKYNRDKMKTSFCEFLLDQFISTTVIEQ